MQIKLLKFKNFNSFGAEYTTIDFSQVSGLTLLYGQNGTGKSTISEVITFALYGKTPTKKKINSIVNRFNGNLETEIHLHSKNRDIRIIRNLDPDLFEVYEDGVLLDQAYKKNKQQYLENEVYGINYDIFNNIISLSVSDFKSFSKRLSASDKQTIIDRIFGIEFITNMFILNKENISKKKEQINLLQNSLNELNKIIDDTQAKINENKERLLVENEDKRTQFNDLVLILENSIQLIKNDVISLVEKKKGFEQKLHNANITHTKIQSELTNINKKIKLYNSQKCPTCNSDLTTQVHLDYLKSITDLKNEYTEKEEEYLSFHDAINERINLLQTDINNHKVKIDQETKKLFETKVKLESLDKNDMFNELEELIQTTIDRANNYNTQLSVTNSEMQILKIVHDVLHENGIKRVLFNRIMPSFNQEIKTILNKLGVNFRIEIDNKFNTEITYLGKEIPIDTLSTGQLKKIDIAIILTFIKILKTKYYTLNILFLDEVFSSMDTEGRYGILTLLKDLSENYSINIFVVNHSEMPSEMFDFKIEAQMKDNFSFINIEKII